MTEADEVYEFVTRALRRLEEYTPVYDFENCETVQWGLWRANPYEDHGGEG